MDAPAVLLSGNEAIAQGAREAGVHVAAATKLSCVAVVFMSPASSAGADQSEVLRAIVCRA